MLTISERFSELRHKLKLTKDALAEIAGTTGTSIANIEAGRTKSPSAEILAAISSKLSVSLDWLILGQGPMLKGQQPESAGLTSGEATVAESETLLKLAVTEAKLEASQAEIGRLYELLGKSPSSPDAAAGWHYPMIVPQGPRVYARQR